MTEKPLQLLGLFPHEIKELLPDRPAYTASQISGFLRDGKNFDEMTSLPKNLREELAEKYIAVPVKIIKKLKSADGSEKLLYGLYDANMTEGVLIPHAYGDSLCLSTQVGCRMGCSFCASGLDGLVRNLSAGEMLGQVVMVNRERGGTSAKRKITNIVMMGSGEPLDNFAEVLRFLDLAGPNGFGISERNISLSTSGLADKIEELADSGHKITLAISLHAPFDDLRSKLMPINRRYGISRVISSARYYFEQTGRRVIFEYTLIAGENDTDACAQKLAELIKGFPSHVNLIRLNSVKENAYRRPTANAAEAFAAKLESLGVSVTVRRSFGEDIEGACGQLRRRYLADGGLDE